MEQQNYNYEADLIRFGNKEIEVIEVLKKFGFSVLPSKTREYDIVLEGKKCDIKIQKLFENNKIVIETKLIFFNEGWRAQKWGVVNIVDGWLFDYDYIVITDENITKIVVFNLEKFRNEKRYMEYKPTQNKLKTKSGKGWQLVGEFIVFDIEKEKDCIVWQAKLH